jgi:hypothetical protein
MLQNQRVAILVPGPDAGAESIKGVSVIIPGSAVRRDTQTIIAGMSFTDEIR